MSTYGEDESERDEVMGSAESTYDDVGSSLKEFLAKFK